MNRSIGTVGDVRGWLVICSVIGALGCGAESGPHYTSNMVPSGVRTDTTQYKQQIAQYPIVRTPHTRKRKAGCWYLACSVLVTIEGRGNTLAIDPNNGPEPAVLVAHLVNTDPEKTEKYYGLLPGTQAEYDLWVGRIPGSGQAEWRLVKMSHTANSVTAAPPTDLNYCHQPPMGNPTSEADFAADRPEGSCNVPLPAANANVRRSSMTGTPAFIGLLQHALAFLVTYANSGGAWIYCNNGCCT
jgi:hypothetical protein